MTDQPCQHADEFGVTVTVTRMEDTGRFTADIKVRCASCGEPFRFLGVPPGIRWDRPTCSIDGLELHVPIEPEGEPRMFAGATFAMPPELGPVKGNA